MPMYAYRCGKCGTSQDVFKSIRLLDTPEPCENCQTEMERQLCAPMVQADYPGYSCPISGDWIEGRVAHERNLKKHGCRVYEPGEMGDHERHKAHEALNFERAVEGTVEEFVEKLPARKREQLAIELENGADLGVVKF